MLSIILPSRNEQFLKPTTEELLKKATGKIEVIVVLDGYWLTKEEVVEDPRVVYLHKGKAEGMRAGINSGVVIARGEHVMKLDAHCMVGEGFDEILTKDLEKDWVAVPTRKRLDAENWCIQETGKPDIDYMYVSYPDDPADFGGPGLNGKLWEEKNRDQNLKKDKIVDCLSAQGSCWVMHKDYFHKLELMDEKSYGHFWNEFQEIGFKCWLSGGRVIRNKNTWYAHLHKGKKYGRGYFLSKSSLDQGAVHTKKWMRFREAWDKQTLPLSWLIEKFSPVPGWTSERIEALKANEGFSEDK